MSAISWDCVATTGVPAPTIDAIREAMVKVREVQELYEQQHDFGSVVMPRAMWKPLIATPPGVILPNYGTLYGLPVYVCDSDDEAIRWAVELHRDGKRPVLVGFSEDVVRRANIVAMAFV